MLYRHLRKAIEGEAVQFKADGSNDSIIASWFNLHPQRVKETNVLSAHTLNGVARRVEREGERPDGSTAGSDGKRTVRLKKFDGDWLIRTKTGGLYVTTAYDFATHWAKKDTFPPEKIQRVESEPPPRLAPKKPEEPRASFSDRLKGKK